MNKERELTVNALALEHWQYVESIAKKMYIDAFIHGHKHGRFDRKIIQSLFKKMK